MICTIDGIYLASVVIIGDPSVLVSSFSQSLLVWHVRFAYGQVCEKSITVGLLWFVSSHVGAIDSLCER